MTDEKKVKVAEVEAHVKELVSAQESHHFETAADLFLKGLKEESRGLADVPRNALTRAFSAIENPYARPNAMAYSGDLADGFEWSRQDLVDAVERKFPGPGKR